MKLMTMSRIARAKDTGHIRSCTITCYAKQDGPKTKITVLRNLLDRVANAKDVYTRAEHMRAVWAYIREHLDGEVVDYAVQRLQQGAENEPSYWFEVKELKCQPKTHPKRSAPSSSARTKKSRSTTKSGPTTKRAARTGTKAATAKAKKPRSKRQ